MLVVALEASVHAVARERSSGCHQASSANRRCEPKKKEKPSQRELNKSRKERQHKTHKPTPHATCAQTESMPFAELYQSLHPIAKAALGTVVVLQGVALLAWGYWLVAEIRSDSVQAREKKNK